MTRTNPRLVARRVAFMAAGFIVADYAISKLNSPRLPSFFFKKAIDSDRSSTGTTTHK